ncbi:glycosyltransferase [Propionicicella superfundia]|uniref:glycosyltransferase n=1 Tax=Propionicicella superfundia TaxID=348582 RepID=UPI00048F9E0D|nr:glycosyltransferase [Propionicicella superfundia]
MKVVVAGFGSTGDTVPLIALAVGLRRAGHEVVLVADQEAGMSATRLGLDFRKLAGSAQTVVTEGSHGWSETIESGRTSPRLLAELARFNTRAWIETITDAAVGADAIVASTLGVYAAASVAQDQTIPLVFAPLQPTLATREYPPPASGLTRTPRWLNRPLATVIARVGDLAFSRGVDQARRDLGRPRLRLAWDEIPILMAWSPTLLPAARDWAHPDFTVTGAWHLPTPPEWQPPAGLIEFLDAGDPPVYVGFGSMSGFSGAAGLRDRILGGLSGHRVVLASGWAGLTDTELPGNVYPVGYVPHDWLFPQCSVVVHHCGAGTSQQAARSGVPSIPVPFTADQPFWAARLHKLDIATSPLNPRRLISKDLQTALVHAASDSTQQRALAVAQRMAAEPNGVTTAIESLQRLIAQ